MTDHSDLIERLRKLKVWDDYPSNQSLGDEAASALSSQSLSLSEAREEIERLKGLVAGIRAIPARTHQRSEAISDERLAEVRAGLGSLPTEPWVNDAPGCVGINYQRGGKETVCTTPWERPRDIAIAAHIARCDRPTMLSLLARLDAGEAALQEIARQETTKERRAAYGQEYEADWEGGYDACIHCARSALENGPAGLADATNNPASSDLSSLRKGAEVAVKPLEWRSFGIHWTASAGFAGVYAVFLGEREQYQLRRDGIILGNFAEAEAAKAAAQSDFETRIRSALVSGSREDGNG